MQTTILGRYSFCNKLDEIEYDKYQRQYTSAVHLFYRYLCRQTKNGIKLKNKNSYYFKDSPMLQWFMTLNNIELIQECEWFRHCAFYDAYDVIYTCGRHVVFGGIRDYKDYLKGMMNKEDYLQLKLRPFYSIGTAAPYKGNLKFRLTEDLRHIIFQPSRDKHYELEIYDLPHNRMSMLNTLYKLLEEKKLAISYNLLQDRKIAISFDIKLFCDALYERIENRIFAEDMNPNNIGWVIVDWLSPNKFNVIDYGVEDISLLNKKEDELKVKLGKASTGQYHYTELKTYVMRDIAVKLSKKIAHYRCDTAGIDGVSIATSDKKKGRYYNRLVNNKWQRNEYDYTLLKNIALSGVYIDSVYCAYTSVNGNFLFRSLGLPDMCLAALETSRRAYLDKLLNLTEKEKRLEEIIFSIREQFPEMFDKSCEEFDIKNKNLTIKEIYLQHLKKLNGRYRVKLEKVKGNMKEIVYNKKYKTSLIKK